MSVDRWREVADDLYAALSGVYDLTPVESQAVEAISDYETLVREDEDD